MSYVYGGPGEFDRDERAAFDAHLALCEGCRTELAAFEEVRVALGGWSPPRLRSEGSLRFGLSGREAPAPSRRKSWRDIPVWAQTAAALLCLGVAAGMANLDVHYGADGLRVRTGWSASPAAGIQPAADAGSRVEIAPWRAELTALEQRLRTDLRQAPAGPADGSGAEAERRVRTLVGESERRQQRELALRLAEAVREMSAQRQADLLKIDRNIGAVQSSTGREMLRQRSEMLNYVTVRTASQRGQ